MVRSATSAALFGALVAAAPLDPAAAQTAGDFTLKAMPGTAVEREAVPALRPDPFKLLDGNFERPPDLFGIPLTRDPNAERRERGWTFGVRPIKGVRAVAALRF